MGMTLADFQATGKYCRRRDELMILVNNTMAFLRRYFSRMGGRESGPGAEETLSFWINFLISRGEAKAESGVRVKESVAAKAR